MRLNKMGWVAAMTLCSLVSLQPLARAQEKKEGTKPASPAPATPPAPGAPGGTPAAPLNPQELRARRAEAQLKSMARTLTLTDEQQAKIKPILEEQFKKYEEMQQDKNLPMEERRKKMMEIRDASQAKIKPILTAEQQTKMDGMRARTQIRPPGGPENPAFPKAPPPSAPAPAK